MTQPRQIAPGKTYLITRRTTRRYFIFRPDADGRMQNIFWYCLGVTAGEFGVLVHSATLMSSHPHIVLTDVRGVLPDFLREFHRLLANATKCHRGWPEEVFSANNTNVVELLSANAIVAECGYVIANPVAAGAVRRADEWPGATVAAGDIGRRVVAARRPSAYFCGDNPRWPQTVELPITMPRQIIEQLGSADAGRDAIAREGGRREHAAWNDARLHGRGFCGARRSMSLAITSRGSGWESVGSRKPAFASAGDHVLARLAAQGVRGFRRAYREALELWRCGATAVVFPAGTWLMRVLHHATCEPSPGPG